MLNFIAVDLTSWLVNGPLLARGSANSATPLIVSNAELPRLLPPSTLHLGFVLSLALVCCTASGAGSPWRGFARASSGSVRALVAPSGSIPRMFVAS